MRTLMIAVATSVLVGVTGAAVGAQDTPKAEGDTHGSTQRARARLSPSAPAATLEQMTLRSTLLRGATARTDVAPPLLPVNRHWAPRRHFGPLYGNSPDVHLNGSAAAFVYNRYFTNNPDAEVFKKYYGSLPSNTPTLPELVPGVAPGAGGFRDVRLGFDRLTYTSRYGGSFRLAFRSLEDYQIEFRKATTVWDIASLEMLVYVTPVATLFNPNAPLYFPGKLWVEFRPQGVVAYTVSTSGLAVQPGDPMPSLLTALSEAAQAIPTGPFALDATRFSHGLVHAAFWEEIGQTNNVAAIEISDGFFLPHTAPGRGVAFVATAVSDISLDTEPGDEEIYVTVDAAHMFQGVSIPPTFSWEFPETGDHGSTPWQTVGVFPLDWDCGQLQTVILMLSVREADALSFDDRFVTDPAAYQTGALDCAGMQAAFNSGAFGLYEELPDQQLLLVKGGDVAGALTARMRVYVWKR